MPENAKESWRLENNEDSQKYYTKNPSKVSRKNPEIIIRILQGVIKNPALESKDSQRVLTSQRISKYPSLEVSQRV